MKIRSYTINKCLKCGGEKLKQNCERRGVGRCKFCWSTSREYTHAIVRGGRDQCAECQLWFVVLPGAVERWMRLRMCLRCASEKAKRMRDIDTRLNMGEAVSVEEGAELEKWVEFSWERAIIDDAGEWRKKGVDLG